MPNWSAVIIGLLAGALLGATMLLVRERSIRDDWQSYRQQAMEALLVEMAADTAQIAQAPPRVATTPIQAGDPIGLERRNAIVAATERAAPTVVTITVTQRVAMRNPHKLFFDRFYPDRRSSRSAYFDRQSYGSGVIVSGEGYVVTNAHVVGSNPVRVLVTLSDGTSYGAEHVETVDRYDLALLKIEGQGFPVANLADSDEIMIGEWAIAIGSPFGQLLADTRPTVTVGVISALNRDIVRQSQSDRFYLGMIQTDAAINPGNSGGALLNARGEVVGINTFIFSDSGGSIGIGFAVPANRVRWLLEEVREFGHYREANWGMNVLALTGELMAAYHISNPVGYFVSDVTEDSPAWRAGLRHADVLRAINGVALDSEDTVTRLVYDAMVGDRVTFTAERDGELFTGEIVLEEVQQ